MALAILSLVVVFILMLLVHILQWPNKLAESEILSDIINLEMVPMALACCSWKERFCSFNINFNSDNMAVVLILNSKSSKSDRVMSLDILIVQWSMECSGKPSVAEHQKRI